MLYCQEGTEYAPFQRVRNPLAHVCHARLAWPPAEVFCRLRPRELAPELRMEERERRRAARDGALAGLREAVTYVGPLA